MVRSKLLDALLRENPHLRRSDVERAVEALFGALSSALVSGRRIELRRFGAFTTKVRPSYIGRNPVTGAKVEVPTRRTIAFRAGAPLLMRLNSDHPVAAQDPANGEQQPNLGSSSPPDEGAGITFSPLGTNKRNGPELSL